MGRDPAADAVEAESCQRIAQGRNDRVPRLPQVDHALLSHCHEDHLAGLFLFPDAACHVHEADRIGLQSLDGMLAMQLQEATVWLNLRERLNWAAFPLSGTFQTLDGFVVMVGAFKPNPLQEICRGLGIEDLSADPRYANHDAQVTHRDDLQARWREEFGKRTTRQAIDALESVDILCAPVNDIEAALADPQIEENEMVLEMRHPEIGPIKTVGIPVKLEGTPGDVRRAPPKLGEHTREVLAELGFSTEEIAALLS